MMEPKGIVGACECAKQKWISVDDRLPDPDCPVLVHYECGTITIDQFTYENNSPMWGSRGCATHWMPLPLPPK